MEVYAQLDPLYLALTAFNQRRHEQAALHASKVLDKNPLDQVNSHCCSYAICFGLV